MLGFSEIGIDLGRHEIKIAKVEEISSELDDLNHLKSYDSYPVNSEMYSKEYFLELKRAINSFAKKIKRSRLSLNFVLPTNEYTNTLFMSVPAVDSKDLDEGIKFEVDQVLGNKRKSDYKSTWKIIDEHEDTNQYEILLTTLDSNVIKSLSQFKTIKWRINRVMLQPVILERFVKTNDVIVDFGHKDTRVYMYKDGQLSEVETIDIGGFDIEKEIDSYMEENNIEYNDEVEEMLNNVYVKNNFIEEEGLIGEISDRIQPLITQLLDETKRNIRSFELQNGLNIDEVYYTGGVFNLKYLDMTLESELDVNIKSLDIVSKDFEDVKYDLAGLAMITPKMKDRMDFSQFIMANIDYTSILTAVLAVSLSTTLTLGVMNNEYDDILSEQSLKEAEQSEVVHNLDDKIMAAEESIERNIRFVDKIETLKNEKKWLSDALYVIPEIVPLSIAVDDLNIKDKNIVIKGYSADYSSIGFFAKKLEEIGNATVRSIDNYEGDTVYSVVTDNPEKISNKYLMTKRFEIIFNHHGELLKR